jgi:hypothetical protein
MDKHHSEMKAKMDKHHSEMKAIRAEENAKMEKYNSDVIAHLDVSFVVHFKFQLK